MTIIQLSIDRKIDKDIVMGFPGGASGKDWQATVHGFAKSRTLLSARASQQPS